MAWRGRQEARGREGGREGGRTQINTHMPACALTLCILVRIQIGYLKLETLIGTALTPCPQPTTGPLVQADVRMRCFSKYVPVPGTW